MFRPFRTGAAVTAALALAVLPAMPVLAHSTVEETTPREGEVLRELPAEFSITADESLLDLGGEGRGFAMVIRDAEGLYYGDGCTTVDGLTMSTPATLGVAGDYTITWQLLSADGHPRSGTIDFKWAPEGDHEVTAGSTEPGECADPGTAAAGDADADQNAEASDSTDDAASALPYWIAGGLGVALIATAAVLVWARRSPRKQP